jgi:radical SAM superfamily enzyme YgiQ (UPF0313 family)
MTKILLIQPNYDLDNPQHVPNTPITLIELATYVNSNGHESIILDRNIYWNDEKLKEVLEKFKPSIVGVTCYTSAMIKDVIYLSKFIKNNTDALFIVGGIHATLEPQSLLDLPEVDYVVREEGEIALLEMCDLVKENKIEDIKKLNNINYNKINILLLLSLQAEGVWDNVDSVIIEIET